MTADAKTRRGQTVAEKMRENRLRQAVARQRYRLHKIRRVDRMAWDYGRYHITDPTTSAVVADLPNLDAVEDWTKTRH